MAQAHAPVPAPAPVFAEAPSATAASMSRETIKVGDLTYTVLEEMGKGGSSVVYRVIGEGMFVVVVVVWMFSDMFFFLLSNFNVQTHVCMR